MDEQIVKPSGVGDGRGFFDHVAEKVGEIVSRGPFFSLCFLLVVGWVLALPFKGWDNELWHLVLNSPTTSITFLLVSLDANTNRRDSLALNHKLNAIADALADFMEADDKELGGHVEELRAAVGLERRESA